MADAHDDVRHVSQAVGVRGVGLGASAGGLEPLQQFLAEVPADSGLTHAVVQRMDPTYKIMLGELPRRTPSMPVLEAIHAHHIEPNTVHVIPAGAELTVRGGALQAADLRQRSECRCHCGCAHGPPRRDRRS